MAGGGADGDADEEWVQSGAEVPDDHPVQQYLKSIELGEDRDINEPEEVDDPDFWPKDDQDWPLNVDKGRLSTRDQALKGAEHLQNFMDANPKCMEHFKGGCGGATVYLMGMRRGVEGCHEPMGQRQATMPEAMANAEKAEKAGIMRDIIESLKNLDKFDKAALHSLHAMVRAMQRPEMCDRV